MTDKNDTAREVWVGVPEVDHTEGYCTPCARVQEIAYKGLSPTCKVCGSGRIVPEEKIQQLPEETPNTPSPIIWKKTDREIIDNLVARVVALEATVTRLETVVTRLVQ